MKRSRSPSPNDASAPKRRRSLETDVNNIPEPDNPPQSRAEYWDPVTKHLSLLRRYDIPRMGGLDLVDVRLTISKDDRTPPEFNLSEEQLSSLTHHFGNNVIEQLDVLVANLGPDPDLLEQLSRQVQHFDEDPTGKEPKFAGSGVDRLLNPSGSGLPIWRATDQPSITVQISQQTKLYDLGSREKNRAYIFPRLHADTYVSATRIYDFAYSLDKSICDQETLNELNDEKSANHFPCFSADGTTLIPLVTGEVKVLGHYRKQREQQEVYATFFIMAWLILRAHMKGKDRWESNEDFSQGVHHCCFSMSPSSLEIWEYKPKVSSVTGDFRVQGQLLCSGHPCDEVFMKQVYIPWRRYVMKRSIIQQWLYLVPAIRAYAKLPWPRPFSRPEPLFLRARELKPASYELDSVTFSTAPSPERERLKELIAKAEEAAALAARIKKRKKLEGFPTSSTGTPTESQSVTGSFISSFG